MAKTTLKDLETLADNLDSVRLYRSGLGGYNADADTILFLTKSLLGVVQEIIALRKEIAKLKKKKP